MFTIDRLAKLDDIATAVFKALRAGIDWLGLKYEDFLVAATYRVVEAKAGAVNKAEEKVKALEDAHIALEADFEEAKDRLKAKYHIALGILEEDHYAKDDALCADLSEAVQKLDAAGKDYDATVDEALVKLDVEINK